MMDFTKYASTVPYNKENKVAWREDNARKMELFRKDLEEEFGTDKAPQVKRDKLFEIAWSIGHSCGYSEVCIYYSEMAELIL